eukprot:4340999-Prorocentrum_lima.AAC.1
MLMSSAPKERIRSNSVLAAAHPSNLNRQPQSAARKGTWPQSPLTLGPPRPSPALAISLYTLSEKIRCQAQPFAPSIVVCALLGRAQTLSGERLHQT